MTDFEQIRFLLPVAYALADRFAGGGAPKLDAKLPGRAVFWAALALMGLGWLLGGLAGLLFGLAWGIYRSIPFFKSSGAPRNAEEGFWAFVRHLLIVPAAALIAYWRHLPMDLTVAGFLAYALFVALLACWYGATVEEHERDHELGGKENTVLEALRGFLFGAAVWLALWVGHVPAGAITGWAPV